MEKKLTLEDKLLSYFSTLKPEEVKMYSSYPLPDSVVIQEWGYWDIDKLSKNRFISREVRDKYKKLEIKYEDEKENSSIFVLDEPEVVKKSDSDNLFLTEDQVENNWKIFNKKVLATNPALTSKLIRRHLKELDFKLLSENPGLSEDFVEEFWQKLNKLEMMKNPSLTTRLMIKYWDELDHKKISTHPNLTEELAVEHFDQLDKAGLLVRFYMNRK